MDGLSGSVAINTGSQLRIWHLSPLEMVELSAHKYGFYSVDMKDNDVGNYTIVAYKNSKNGPGSVSLRATGKTEEEACRKLVDKFFKEDC